MTLPNPFEYRVSTAKLTDGYHFSTPPIFLATMKDPERWDVANLVLRGDVEIDSYTIIAGLWELLCRMEHWVVDEVVQKSMRKKNMKEEDIQRMAGRKFEGKIYAVRDGEVMFTGPIMRLEGPKWQVKWVESVFTNHLRRCSSVATKAARVCSVVPFEHKKLDASFRRSNDTDGVWTARSAYLAGFTGTSNALAGEMFNIPWGGTVDHYTMQSLILEFFEQNFDLPINEQTQREAQRFAYRAIIKTYPENYALLIDTINFQFGLEDAIIVLKELKPKNYTLRQDSGDLALCSDIMRKRLDEKGLHDVEIAPSGGLSAITVKSLLDQGCAGSNWQFGEYFQFGGERAREGATLSEPPVNVQFIQKFGGTSDGAWESIKLSENIAKNSLPGRQQRIRLLTDDGMFDGDVIINENQYTLPNGDVIEQEIRSVRRNKPAKSKTILPGQKFYLPMQCVFEKGKFFQYELYELETARTFHAVQMEKLPDQYKRVDGSHAIYGVGLEKELDLRAYSLSVDQIIVHKNR
jgi:putative nicotinate phosphoribosyltransferase